VGLPLLIIHAAVVEHIPEPLPPPHVIHRHVDASRAELAARPPVDAGEALSGTVLMTLSGCRWCARR
jgi:hypothetical protein